MATDQVHALKEKAQEAIDQHSTGLYDLNQRILKNPELAFKETYAHAQLTEFLAAHGFEVTPHYTLDTAFRAETGGDGGLTVGLICEYDALPVVGHACGHNLIAESGVAAALGLKIALQSTQEKPKVKIVVFGTPAEEHGCGKVLMINSDCFKSVDVCMMVHPYPVDVLKPTVLCDCTVTVTFKGHAAHAAAYPWEGVNALDAAVMAYANVSVLRQQMKPTWRVHGIITQGGIKPNIIPDRAQLMFEIRTQNEEELDELSEKVTNCFKSAALSTGCEVSLEWETPYAANMDHNNTLAKLYQTNAESLGVIFPREETCAISTDMGNVSHVVPSIHPMYAIGTTAANHSHAFTSAAGTEEAHKKTLVASKALAMTAIDVLCSPDLIAKIQSDFEKSHHLKRKK